MCPFPERESLDLLSERRSSLLHALDTSLGQKITTTQEIRDVQWLALTKLIHHAYESVPLYQKKYDAAGFHPSMLHSLDDLCLIPLLTKQELRAASLDDLTSQHAPAARLIASSGSTGIPSRMFRDESSLWQFMAANMMLYHDWCHGRPYEEALYFVDFAPDSIDFVIADFLRTIVPEDRLLPVTLSTQEMIEKIREFSPQFISSYPSTMRSIAMTMVRNGEFNHQLRLLHLTSEKLDGNTRDLIQRVFPHVRIVETYTSSEGGLIAWSCTAGDHRLHLSENSGIYETIDHILVITDLTNFSTPIIRYSGMNDFCTIIDSPCACGSPMRAIRGLEGRSAETISLSDGRVISPYVLLNAMEEVTGVLHYQIIQHSRDDIEILIVPAESYIPASVCKALPIPIREKIVDQIKPKAGAHKVPLIVSHL
jgi:phenylacetate-CoA ligase